MFDIFIFIFCNFINKYTLTKFYLILKNATKKNIINK